MTRKREFHWRNAAGNIHFVDLGLFELYVHPDTENEGMFFAEVVFLGIGRVHYTTKGDGVPLEKAKADCEKWFLNWCERAKKLLAEFDGD